MTETYIMVWNLELWTLEFIWSLVLDAWNFLILVIGAYLLFDAWKLEF
jgi:hypothetical protein